MNYQLKYKLKLLLILLGYLSQALTAQTVIEPILESYKKDKDLQHAQFSFCIMEAATGKVIKEYNSEMGLIPASTLKIMVTSTALGLLSKDFTYKTGYYFIDKTDSISGIK